MRFVFSLVLCLALFGVICLCRLSFKTLCLSESRLCSLLLFRPVRIVALGVINVGINYLFGSGYSLDLLYLYGLVTAVECHECGGNSSLVLLSVIRSVVCRGREFLLNLGNGSGRGLLFGVVGLDVGIYGLCRLIPCRRLLCLIKRLIFLLLLFHSSGKERELFTFSTSVSLIALHVIVLITESIICINCNACLLEITYTVCLYICICGYNNAYRRLVALTVGYEHYYLFT